ncbi:hypothetical protein ACWDMY_29740, partial [Streptomyces globisporus]
MNRSTVEPLLTAQEDTMRDVRRILRAKVLKARGLVEESDGKPAPRRRTDLAQALDGARPRH